MKCLLCDCCDAVRGGRQLPFTHSSEGQLCQICSHQAGPIENFELMVLVELRTIRRLLERRAPPEGGDAA